MVEERAIPVYKRLVRFLIIKTQHEGDGLKGQKMGTSPHKCPLISLPNTLPFRRDLFPPV